MRRLALAALLFTAAVAQAAPPMAGGQAPGWFRMKLGNFEVTALNDGLFKLPVDKLLQTSDPTLVVKPPAGRLPGSAARHLGQHLSDPHRRQAGDDRHRPRRSGRRTHRPGAGKHLKASGYSPEQIDEIYITHFHGDHINGLTDKDGKAVYPNAVVRADQRESGFWLGDAEQGPRGRARRHVECASAS